MKQLTVGARAVIGLDGFEALLTSLARDGYELFGPTVRDGAIVLGPLSGVDALPRGVGDEQAPGGYRLRAREDGALFGFATPMHALKRLFLAPRATLFTSRRTEAGVTVEAPPPPKKRLALVGARACELAALALQDKALWHGPHADADYAARRQDVFVFAVHCSSPGGTCFCASMGTGPRATAGFELAATELLADGHSLLVEVGTERGAAALARIDSRPPTGEELQAARAILDVAAQRMGRQLDTRGLRDLLFANLEHPRWDELATRCLACANCTMSCPTCFCTTTEDTTDLSGAVATRARRWDSCFTADFAWVHGGTVRPSVRARYRQWLTHKLAGWFDQFGASGCVGCGRCITWCPSGIDLTQEVAAIRAQPVANGRGHG